MSKQDAVGVTIAKCKFVTKITIEYIHFGKEIVETGAESLVAAFLFLVSYMEREKEIQKFAGFKLYFV